MKVGTRYEALNEELDPSLAWSMLCVAEVVFDGASYFVCVKDNVSPAESSPLVFDADGIEAEVVAGRFRITNARTKRGASSKCVRLVHTQSE